MRKTPSTSVVRTVYNNIRPLDQTQNVAQHVSRQLTSITNNLNTSNMQTMQSSAFLRRKSYDINASLAQPLKYQPHTGRIHKPVSDAVKLQQIRRQSILNNKNSKGDLLHEQMRMHSGQNDERAKVNQLKQRQEKRIASQMQRRVIEANVDDNE